MHHRWDVNLAADCCSEHVQIIFSALHSTICEIGAKAFTFQGRNVTTHVIDIVRYGCCCTYLFTFLCIPVTTITAHLILWCDKLRSVVMFVEVFCYLLKVENTGVYRGLLPKSTYKKHNNQLFFSHSSTFSNVYSSPVLSRRGTIEHPFL